MPSSITHELIAKSALALLTEEERTSVERAPDYYYLGAQGPDLLFFYEYFAGAKNFGKILHRGRLYEWFSAMHEELSRRTGEEREKCLAYALGFCTHLEADAAFHPFVYAYLEEKGLKKREHQRIENDWDVYFAATLEEKNVRGYTWPFGLIKIDREGVLYAYLRDCAARLGVELKAKKFSHALRFFRWFLVHFHKKRMRYLLPFAPTLYPRRLPDGAILSGECFTRLSGARDADALLLAAADASAQRMREFLSPGPLPPAFSRHLLTGKPMALPSS